MRKMIRAVHFDFHTLPEIPDLCDNFSASEFAQTLSDAKVTYINFFARCNTGFSYYPTKIGVPHPYLKGRDIFGDILKECHKRNIGVTAYFNGGLSHELGRLHREWTVLDKDGKILFGKEGPGVRTMCYNTAYGDHLVAEVKEVLEMYPDVDGIFMDCFSFPAPCFGTECVDAMKAEGIDINNYDEVLRFNNRKRQKMAQRLRDVIPKDKYFYINGSIENDTCFSLGTDYISHGEIECLPSGGWGYDCYPALVAYERNVFDQTVYMTGRFRKSWGDFGGIREKAALEFDAYYALANTSNISVGDHLHPNGTLEKALFDTVGEIYTEIEKTEKWTQENKYVPEIGILVTKKEWLQYGENLKPEFTGGYGIYAVRGAVRMLSELKYQYDVITDDMDFSRFKMLIIPDFMTFTDETAQKISAFLKNGGKVISSGISGLKPDHSDFALREWNFTYDGDAPYELSYFKVRDQIGEGVPQMVTDAYEKGIALIAKEGNTVLADLWDPYFDRVWDGYHAHYYAPYYKKNDKLSAILSQDSVIHISFNIFASYTQTPHPVNKKVVANCIKLLYSDKMLTANVPSFARTSLTTKDNYLLLHVLSYCPEYKGSIAAAVIEEPIKIYENEFSIKWDKAPKKVYFVPTEESVDFKYEDGHININVPKIDGHAIIAMEF